MHWKRRKVSLSATEKKYGITVSTLHDHMWRVKRRRWEQENQQYWHMQKRKRSYIVARRCKKLALGWQRRLFLPLLSISCMRGEDSILLQAGDLVGIGGKGSWKGGQSVFQGNRSTCQPKESPLLTVPPSLGITRMLKNCTRAEALQVPR